MIKLGVTHKDQVKVDSLVSTINSTKLELEEILKKKNLTQKELNDTLTKRDFAVEEGESQAKANEFNLTNTTLKLNQINNEVTKLELVKTNLLDKVIEISNELESSKESIKLELDAFTTSESVVLGDVKLEIDVLMVKKSELEQYIEVLSLDSSNNTIALEDIKSDLVKLEVSLVSKRDEELELSRSYDEVSGTHKVLSDEVVSLQADITNLNEIINTVSVEITKAQTSKAELLEEVDGLNKDKELFAREKFNFSKDRELIMLKEQFIIDKYAIAGVPYK